MRIHTIINSFSLAEGGAERLARRIHENLIHSGHDSTLIGLMRERREDPNTRCEAPAKAICFNQKSPYSIGALYRTLQYIRSEVRSGEIVHAHLFPAIFYCALAKRVPGSKFKLIITEHNTHNRRRNTAIGRILDRFLYATVDHITCISNGAKISLVNWLPQTDSISSVIENGIPLSFQQPLARSNRKPLRIISVGRLTEQKNYETALRAFAIFSGKYPKRAVYSIAGKGALESTLKELTKTLGIVDQVSFLGLVDDVPSLLMDSDLFLIPSKWEGFGLAAVEAMNASLPVIASEVEGLSDIVSRPLKAGILVDPDDPNSIAGALILLCESSDLRKKLGYNGFLRSKDFDEAVMFRQLTELYLSL